MDKYITIPMKEKERKELQAGDSIFLTGTMYVARDAAHKRMYEQLEKGNSLPINIENQFIYYMGPSPTRDNRVIGSAGPTTSSRMDKYSPSLLDLGLKGMIGKGRRSKEVVESIKLNKAVYFAAVGGAGALLSKCIKSAEIICYEELGAEALMKLDVEKFPVIVVIDCNGNNLYDLVIEEYKK